MHRSQRHSCSPQQDCGRREQRARVERRKANLLALESLHVPP